MEFRILGSLEVVHGGTALLLRGGRDQRLLAVLLLDANRFVPLSRLVDALWEDDPPATAAKQVLNAVSRLRVLLDDPRTGRLTGDISGGYRLCVADGELDARTFQTMVGQASAEAAQGLLAEAADLLQTALSMWRGPALSGMDNPVIAAGASAWDEQRLAALDTYYEHRLTLGQHRQVTSELTALAAEHPLREKTVAQLMLALYWGGRRGEALAAYRQARTLLADELGLDPGPDLQRLHQAILSGDPEILAQATTTAPLTVKAAGSAGSAGSATAANAATVVPRQLPAAVRHFVGRADQLQAMTAMCEDAAADRIMIVSAIQGTAGIGKTALAVYWAHKVADRFPDGQLHVNLQGFDPAASPMTAGKAVRGFLDALGVPAERIPADLDAQAALYRSLLAGRRTLILLDNARDDAQVRPLLPGSPDCLVIVTSRKQLTGLIVNEGAHPLTLDLLDDDECRELLARRLGPARLDDEPEAVTELIGLCARLPLALSIAAARAAAQPTLPIASLTSQLHDSRDRLDTLATGDAATDIRAVFAWSYDSLNGTTARMFRLLGLHPGPDISQLAAASLAGLPRHSARAALTELTRAHLLTEHVLGRYTFHDLLRAYASEQTHVLDGESDRDATIRRILDHYLHTGYTASRWLAKIRAPLDLAESAAGVRAEDAPGATEARAWFESEHRVLLRTVELAAANGFDRHAWQISWTLVPFLFRSGNWHDWTATQQIALAATKRLDDLAAEAKVHNDLGNANSRLGEFGEARKHFEQVLRLPGGTGDILDRAEAYSNLGVLFDHEDDPGQALDAVRQALRLYHEVGHQAGQAICFTAIGWCLARLGRHEEALTACQQALSLNRDAGNANAEANDWDSMGYTYSRMGNHQKALACYSEALALFRRLGDRYYQALVLSHAGDCHESSGDYQAARDTWREAVVILDDLHHPDAEVIRGRLFRERANASVSGRRVAAYTGRTGRQAGSVRDCDP